MNPTPTEWMWLDARATITLAELAQVSGLTRDELNELIDYGALVSLTPDPSEGIFSAHCVVRLRKASQLRQDFDLDLFTVAMLLDHLSRIEELERQIEQFKARLPSSDPL